MAQDDGRFGSGWWELCALPGPALRRVKSCGQNPRSSAIIFALRAVLYRILKEER